MGKCVNAEERWRGDGVQIWWVSFPFKNLESKEISQTLNPKSRLLQICTFLQPITKSIICKMSWKKLKIFNSPKKQKIEKNTSSPQNAKPLNLKKFTNALLGNFQLLLVHRHLHISPSKHQNPSPTYELQYDRNTAPVASKRPNREGDKFIGKSFTCNTTIPVLVDWWGAKICNI